MLNDSDEVEFQISAAAIDELLGGPGGGPVDREIRFSLLRETIERLASDEFSSSNFARALRIFAKDTQKKIENMTAPFKIPKNGSSRSRSA